MKTTSMKPARFSKDFILVAVGQIISLFGNQILRFALPLYLLNQTGSAALFGTIMAVSVIPMILFYPIGGIIADRVDKRNIMVILDFCTAILVLLFCFFAGSLDIVALIALTMVILCGIQGAYQPAVKASIPVLVKTEHIMQANSVVDLINSLANMAGPVIGGILFSIVGLTPILYVSIACFFAAALMLSFILIPYEKRPAPGNLLAIGWGDLKESSRFMFKEQPVLWKVSVLIASLGLLLTSLVLIGVPVLITQHLGFTPDTANRLYGYAQGVIAVGAIVGGLVAGIFSGKLKLRASPLIFTGEALSILIIGIALQTLTNPMAIYVILAIGSGLLVALSTIFQIQIMTCIQLLTPKELIGKVISCVICICMCILPLGQFIYGIVFENIGNYTWLPFYAAALIVTGITFYTRHLFYGIEHLYGRQSSAHQTLILPTPLFDQA